MPHYQVVTNCNKLRLQTVGITTVTIVTIYL